MILVIFWQFLLERASFCLKHIAFSGPYNFYKGFRKFIDAKRGMADHLSTSAFPLMSLGLIEPIKWKPHNCSPISPSQYFPHLCGHLPSVGYQRPRLKTLWFPSLACLAPLLRQSGMQWSVRHLLPSLPIKCFLPSFNKFNDIHSF